MVNDDSLESKEKTRFVVHEDQLQDLLTRIVIKGEIFDPSLEIKMWKSAYEMVYGIEQALKIEIDAWKKSANFEAIGGHTLQQLEKVSNTFVKQIQKKGIKSGCWQGEEDECGWLLQEYRTKTAPLINDLSKQISANNPARNEIQQAIGSYFVVSPK